MPTREGELISEKYSQFGLESEIRLMKLKSLVIAYQNDAVNTFSDLVHTARQARIS